ncbi:hypothetical protein BLA29_012491, partial [Euroglyphus maynei]
IPVATSSRYSNVSLSGESTPGPNGSTNISTRPCDLAFFGLMFLAINIICSASGTLINFGSRCVPPPPGNKPNMTSGNENTVLLLLTAIR